MCVRVCVCVGGGGVFKSINAACVRKISHCSVFRFCAYLCLPWNGLLCVMYGLVLQVMHLYVIHFSSSW